MTPESLSLEALMPESLPTETELAECLIRDRHAFARWLRGLHRRARAGQPCDRALARLREDIVRSRAVVGQRRARRPAVVYPPELPVSERRAEIAALIERHQVTVLCGETGSGKSTQLPKLCLDLGRGLFGRIGHTQPRRLAARSLAARVAAELHGEVGGVVGYKVRFHDRVRPDTAIKLMTDGILLAEIQQDRWLAEYDTLIVDEAHERSLNIDFLLGYLKGILPKRPDLKLIVTSATIDPQRFAEHFRAADGTPAPIVEVSGRTWPVEVRYRPPSEEHAGERDEAMQGAIGDALDELARAGSGDVLVFLSGEREIRETAETLRRRHPPGTEILPLFARQGPAEQARVFQPHSTRRVVLATNVAETSLTVPGIRYVIDPGFARISRYSHRTRVQRLPVERVSQASAAQRAGRCGRVAAGICIRLYTEDNYAARAEFTAPEIARTNLAAVILRMKQLGFGAIEHFPFIEPPDSRLVADGYRTLEELAALDGSGRLTPLGQQLARLSVDPRIGRMLLAAAEGRCLAEVLVIAAALSVQDPRERPLEQRQAADEIHATFVHPESDFLALLNLWRFLEQERRHLSRSKFRQLCQRHFLSWNRVQEWRDIHAQLREQLLEMGLRENTAPAGLEEIHRALLSGLLINVGLREGRREFQGSRNSRFMLHPGSGLAAKPPKWVMVAERVETSRQYGRSAGQVQPGWIESAAQHLVQRSYAEPHWQAKSGQVAAFEQVSLYGLTLVARRRVNYGPINPAEAREIFLRFALTEGDFQTRAPFWRHNQALIAAIHDLEAKARRRDLLVDDEAIYAFYAARLPSGIYSAPQFEKWLRQATRTRPKILHMCRADLLRNDALQPAERDFPDRLPVGASALPLQYRFEPGNPADGTTLVVPLALVNQLSAAQLEWLVPGLLEERVIALLRALPKSLRRPLAPVPDTARRLLAGLTPSQRPLRQMLSEALREQTGVYVPDDQWDESALPEHLRMKVRVVDDDGTTLALERDVALLRERFGERARQGFACLQQPASTLDLERTGISRWDFDVLPERVELERAGIRFQGYPALVDRGDSVAIEVLDAVERAAAVHRAGVRRLIVLHLGVQLRELRGRLRRLDRMRLQYAKAPLLLAGRAHEPAPDLADEVLALVLDRTFLDERPAVRSKEEFERRLRDCADALTGQAAEVVALLERIMDAYQGLRLRLADARQINWLAAIQDVRTQLDALVFRGFIGQVAFVRLREYPRYLRAIEQRLERLIHAPERDRRWMAEMAEVQMRWRERWAGGEDDPRLEEIRWLIEELRVSLFAQQLGTAVPVSVKRVSQRWRELGL